MARPSAKDREKARLLFVTGEVPSNAELARRLRVKPHTIGEWRRLDGWDDLRLRAERRAAEKLVEQIANDRVSLNSKHFKAWDLVFSQVVSRVKEDGALDWNRIEKLSAIIDRLQKGQRLAKEMASNGVREEEARAGHAAELRTLVDVFISAIKENVSDEPTRDRIVDAIRARLPAEPADGGGEPGTAGDD